MAQFKFKDEAKIRQEKNEAIESLIPGTVYYFHLYFLDLMETKKKVDQFNEEDAKLWKQFQKKHGLTAHFYEVETQFNLLCKLEEEVPSTVSAETS